MTDIVDYAMPMMRIETILKKMHNALLDHQMDAALMMAVDLASECRFLRNSLIIMKDKHDAIRQQTKTVQEGISATAGPGGAREPDGPATSSPLNGRQRH